jgi:hypothetical protein
MGDRKVPRWENEEWIVQVPKDDIICKYCMFRKPDQKAGSAILKGHIYGACELFPNGKPNGILFNDAKCGYFVDERDDGEVG